MHATMNEQPSKYYPNLDQNLKYMIFGGTIMDKGNVQIAPSVIDWHQYVSAKNVKITKFYTSLYLNQYNYRKIFIFRTPYYRNTTNNTCLVEI